MFSTFLFYTQCFCSVGPGETSVSARVFLGVLHPYNLFIPVALLATKAHSPFLFFLPPQLDSFNAAPLSLLSTALFLTVSTKAERQPD